MTSSTATAALLDFGALATDDPRRTFTRAVLTAADAIAAVRPEQMTNPTPCGEFDVRGMLGHLVSVLERVAIIGRQENPFAVGDTVEPVADDAWSDAWADAAAQVRSAWADGAALTRPTPLPWAAESGDLALRSYTAELTTHTWDLAVATAQQPAWDDEVCLVSLDVMRAILPATGRQEMFEAMRADMPPEIRSFTDPYGAAVAVDSGAPLIDQLVAYVGRRPERT